MPFQELVKRRFGNEKMGANHSLKAARNRVSELGVQALHRRLCALKRRFIFAFRRLVKDRLGTLFCFFFFRLVFFTTFANLKSVFF